MALESVSVHKHAKKNEFVQYPAILTARFVNNPYVLPKGKDVPCKPAKQRDRRNRLKVAQNSFLHLDFDRLL